MLARHMLLKIIDDNIAAEINLKGTMSSECKWCMKIFCILIRIWIIRSQITVSVNSYNTDLRLKLSRAVRLEFLQLCQNNIPTDYTRGSKNLSLEKLPRFESFHHVDGHGGLRGILKNGVPTMVMKQLKWNLQGFRLVQASFRKLDKEHF